MTTPSSAFTVPSGRPQKLKASSSVGALPSSHSRLQDSTNITELSLPPNALNILARCQAAGRLSALMTPSSQPAPAAKSVTTTKRPTARSCSQPNLLKTGGSSTYARGVPIPKPVPQPLEAALYQPPPMKARARRAAQAAKATARAASPAATDGPVKLTASWGNRAGTASLPTLPSGSAPQAVAASQTATAPTHLGGAGASAALARNNMVWGDRTKNPSLSTLQRGSVAQQATTSQAETMSTPQTANALPAAPARSNTLWGDWDDCATSTSLFEPQPARAPPQTTQSQAKPPTAPARPTGSLGERAKSLSMPALQPKAPSQNSGPSCIPASLIERLLPRLAEAASLPKRSSSWVAGDAGIQGTTASSLSARHNGTPLPSIMEVPTQEGPGLLPAMEVPTQEGPGLLPAMEVPTQERPGLLPAMELPERVPTPVLPDQSQLLMELLGWVPTAEDYEPMSRRDWMRLPVPIYRQSALGRVITDDFSASEMLENILNFNSAVEDEHRITPPTRTEIETSLSASMTLPTDLDHDVEMTEAGMQELVQLAVDLLDESWTGYVDLEGCERV